MSFFLVDWYWWLLAFGAYSALIHLIWPDIAFWSLLFSCINFRLIYRAFDAFEELWERTEKLRKDEES